MVKSKKPVERNPRREKFVKEIRTLFKNAGFNKGEIAIQPPTAEGPNIIIIHTAEDRSKIKLLIQCKSAEKRKEFPDLNGWIRKYSSYVREEGADIALLILKGYDIQLKFKDKRTMEKIRHTEKVVYWDDRALKYYKITTNVLRFPYARYLILRDLGFHIILQQKPYKVDAIQIRQHLRGRKMWIFSMEPRKLLNLAYVFRKGASDPDAYQRLLDPIRLLRIGDFLSGKNSMLANNIIVAFDTKVQFKNGKLFIPAKTCSAWIVDGQHRLYGFCKIDKKMAKEKKKKILTTFKLPVVGIKTDPRLQAQLFTVINSEQRRINRNLLLDLCDYLDLEPEPGILERIRIVKKLATVDTFKGKLKILPRIEKGTITLATLVDYSKFKKLVRNLGKSSYSVINNFFKAVKDKEYFPEWNESKEFVFSTAKGVRMLVSLLTRIIDYSEREDKKLTSSLMKLCLEKLKNSCAGEPDYFKNSYYKGKALGAGAPDARALDMWAARIDDGLENFLSGGERRKIGRNEKKILLRLEENLRKCIESKLAALTPKWWTERVPPDVTRDAEDRKKRNEKPWPWYGKEDKPLHYYINFSDYRKIIIKRKNWRETFKQIFKDETITSAKLAELEPIRNDIAHNRKLNLEQFEHLKMYTQDLLSCIKSAK